MPHRQLTPSTRLDNVRYEIRGEIYHRSQQLEAEGRDILRLNIGNPGVFGFTTPIHLRAAVEKNLHRSEAYCNEQGLLEAREAIVEQQRTRGASNANVASTFIGNGVSELIDLALRGLLNEGDEVLIPAPDYPLWTASVILNGGVAVHYPCHPANQFFPDPADIEARITTRTRAIVVINPNNPTGAVYPRELLQAIADIAIRHRLVLMADEIYDGIVYDNAKFVPLAALAQDTLCLSFGGLSKVHRACGYRSGWLSLSGAMQRAQEYQHALVLLSALRLCGNVPSQWAIKPALEGEDTITRLCQPGGRLFETRRALDEALKHSEFLTLQKPMGALYAFPGVNENLIPQFSDFRFALDLLEQENVLLVPGSSFNVPFRNHFRLTLLPEASVMREVVVRIERALSRLAEQAQPHSQVA